MFLDCFKYPARIKRPTAHHLGCLCASMGIHMGIGLLLTTTSAINIPKTTPAAPLVLQLTAVPNQKTQPLTASNEHNPTLHTPTGQARNTPSPTSIESHVPSEMPTADKLPTSLSATTTPQHIHIASTTQSDAHPLNNTAPPYPLLSRRRGEEGTVVLRVLVEANGIPSQIEIHTSSRAPRLDEAAVKTVWHWQFVPAYLGEKSMSSWVLVPIIFNLKNDI